MLPKAIGLFYLFSEEPNNAILSRQSASRLFASQASGTDEGNQNGNVLLLKLHLNPQTVLLGLIFHFHHESQLPSFHWRALSVSHAAIHTPPILPYTRTEHTHKQTGLRHYSPESQRIISPFDEVTGNPITVQHETLCVYMYTVYCKYVMQWVGSLRGFDSGSMSAE